jgi:sporulation protein YlmC with PRC-barrel domain
LLGNSFQPVYARDTPDKRKPGHHHHGLTRAADVTSQLSGPKPLKSMALPQPQAGSPKRGDPSAARSSYVICEADQGTLHVRSRERAMMAHERPAIARKEAAAMAEAAGFTIGAEASCSDGVCGKVSRLVIDPVALTVTHLVIEPKHRKETGRLVPVHLVDTTTGHIRLRCSIADFDKLDPAEETDLVEGAGYEGGYSQAGAVQAYGGVGSMGVGGSATGMGIGMGLGHSTPVVVHDVVPLGETDVHRGDRVHALDGEIGQVQGFLVDPGDNHVTHVLLQEGHIWGRKKVAIPISGVTRIDDGIRLNLTKKQLEDLPPVD